MVAASAGLGFGGAAELTTPQDKRAVEQPSSLQIAEQAGHGLVGF